VLGPVLKKITGGDSEERRRAVQFLSESSGAER
jgi:hypothetical protein